MDFLHVWYDTACVLCDVAHEGLDPIARPKGGRSKRKEGTQGKKGGLSMPMLTHIHTTHTHTHIETTSFPPTAKRHRIDKPSLDTIQTPSKLKKKDHPVSCSSSSFLLFHTSSSFLLSLASLFPQPVSSHPFSYLIVPSFPFS